MWKTADQCDKCGSTDFHVLESRDPQTGYRETVYVCRNGHRIDELWEKQEEENTANDQTQNNDRT